MLRTIFLCVLSAVLPLDLVAQTSSFTYQGKLTDNSIAANGTYQMQFSLYDALSDGTQVGATITNDTVTVTNGVFTVVLDFTAPDAFDGNPRFLSIAVKRPTDPAFIPLTPRQTLTSAPYSIKSLNADTANTATNSTQLGGVDAAQYVVTTDARMTDERNPLPNSTNYIQNATSTQANSNFNISNNGSIGGNLGIGTETPFAKLHISGTGGIRARVNSDTNAGVALTLNNQPGWSVATVTGGQFQIFNDAIGQNAFWIDSTSNNVGIGTITPGAKLDVAGGINALTQFNIGGNRILGNQGSLNLFAGVNAGFSNGSGAANTFIGDGAGRLNVAGNGNSFFGRAAGENSTGGGNSFVGVTSGQFATGVNNAYFGAGSGRATAANPNTASENAFFGYQSGMLNTSGNLNAFFGAGAGRSNTTGFFNAFFGGASGLTNDQGTANAFFGMDAGRVNVNGGANSFFGRASGFANTDGNFNVFLGYFAGQSNTTGSYNTVIGTAGNVLSGDLLYATAIGGRASVGNSDTIVLGKTAGTYDGVPRPADAVQIPGNMNVAGTITGTFNGTIATATNALNLGGVAASQFVQTSDSRLSDARIPLPGSGNYIQNSPLSQQSGSFNLGGTGTVGGTLNANILNTATHFETNGIRTLFMDGNASSLYGGFTPTLPTGDLNTFFGILAGNGNTGNRNSFFGNLAGTTNTGGSFNSFFGVAAGESNVTGVENTMLGFRAKPAVGDLSNAAAIGANAFVSQNNSLVLGSINGVNNATADTKVGIGTTAPVSVLHVTGVEPPPGINATEVLRVVGAKGGDSNGIGGNGAGVLIQGGDGGGGFFGGSGGSITLQPGLRALGNPSDGADGVTGNVLLAPTVGNVGIGTTTPSERLHVVGNGLFTGTVSFSPDPGGALSVCRTPTGNRLAVCSSSIRYKTNINTFNPGLNLINRLRPVVFNWKADNMEDVGLVAEEVAAVEPLLATYNDKGEVEGVKYDRVGIVLINAVKEQQVQIEAQRKQIEQQQRQINALKQLLCLTNTTAKVCNGPE